MENRYENGYNCNASRYQFRRDRREPGRRMPIASRRSCCHWFHFELHAQGQHSAEVTVVEYGDYECPHCRRAYPIVQRVQAHFGKRLRLVFRNFPLAEMHPHVEAAAEAAEFEAAQGTIWEMHGLLFEYQKHLAASCS